MARVPFWPGLGAFGLFARVRDPHVWSTVRWLYFGSGLLFLLNISLGILNVFTPGDLPRGQLLAHLHAGTIGWITLSVIATTLWVYSWARFMASTSTSMGLRPDWEMTLV